MPDYKQRNLEILYLYKHYRQTMKQYEALEMLSEKFNIGYDHLLKIITQTKRGAI